MMENRPTDLSRFNNNWYNPGSVVKRVLWYSCNAAFFTSYFPFGSFRVFLLRLFGAKVGNGVVVKPAVNIKYPWNLVIGDHTWIGEKVWIDCLGKVSIGNHACISQGALILSGNHDFSKSTFDLMVKHIIIEDGVWIGAKSVVTQGVTCRSHAVLAVGSVASSDLDAYTIYRGNPAVKVKERQIRD